MEIDQAIAHLLQHAKRRRAAIDELPVRARYRKSPLDEELSVFTRFDSLSLEVYIEDAGIFDVENGFHGATLRACADQALVRTLSEHKLKGADDDGLAGASFPRNRGTPRSERPNKFINESQISNAEGRKRCEHGVSM